MSDPAFIGSSPVAIHGSSLPEVPDHDLLRPIGAGSYGQVWLARNVIGGYRAVKLIQRRQSTHDRAFEREFSGIKRFEPVSRSQENLVSILHVGRSNSAGFFYYVMELADDLESSGEIHPENYRAKTLAGELARRGRLSFSECLRVTLALASALGHLHRQGLIHRDVKPSNIIFVNGVPKLADIGLVAEAGESRSFVGTEGFVPPEGPGTAQADVFSLGKVLYESCTGNDRTQFPKLPADWLQLPDHKQLIELNEVILKACDPDPRSRYPSADALLADLALLQSGESITRLRAMQRRFARLLKLSIVGSAMTVLTLAGSVLALRQAQLAEQSLRESERLRIRAQAAELDSKQKLWRSYLNQARAERQSKRSGQRFNSLEAIASAAQINPDSAELRSEAITALALADMRLLRRFETSYRTIKTHAGDAAGELFAQAEPNGQARIRRMTDGTDVAVLERAGIALEWVLAFSPDSKHLALCYAGGELWIWNLELREPVAKASNWSSVAGYSFTPDGAAFIMARSDGRTDRLDLGTGTMVSSITLPITGAELSFARDGSLLAIGNTETNVIVVVGADSGEVVRRFTLPESVFPFASTWDPSKQLLASVCSDFKTYVWSLSTEDKPMVLQGHEAEVVAVAFHPTGALLATSSWDNTTRLWDLRTGKQLLMQLGWSWEIHFSGNGDRFAMSNGDEKCLATYDFAANHVCRTFAEPLPTHELDQHKGPWGIQFSRDERWILAATFDGIRWFDVESGKVSASLPCGKSGALLLSSDQRTLVAATPRGVSRWQIDCADGTPLIGSETALHDAVHVGKLAGRDDLATVAWSGWGHPIHVLTDRERHFELPDSRGYDHVGMSPNGEWIAATRRFTDGVRIWNTETATLVRTVPSVRDAGLAFNPDNTRFVAADNQFIREWEIQTGTNRWSIPRKQPGRGIAAYSNDGALVAATITARELVLIEANTGTVIARLLHPEEQPAIWVTFSPSDRYLAVSCITHVIQVWDMHLLRRELASMNLDWKTESELRRSSN